MGIKTTIAIQMDYAKALRQANELREVANDLNVEAKRIQHELNSVEGSWKGESANQYVHKMTVLYNKTMHTVSRLRDAASTIEDTATRVKKADERARALAAGSGRHG